MINKLRKYILIAFSAIFLLGCENKLEMFNYGDGLNFIYNNNVDSIFNYSFVYGPSAAVSDTVWVKVETMGYISESSREISFIQIQTDGNNAAPGTHYIPFDDASVKAKYVIKKGESTASLPIIIKRDASLKNSIVTLVLGFKENNYFKSALPKRSRYIIIITDQLSKPANWAAYAIAYFGTYGVVKHQFLIDQTGKKWDDEYLSNELGFTSSTVFAGGINSNYDAAYCNYLVAVLKARLIAFNTSRISQGLDVLKEADGTIVSFN